MHRLILNYNDEDDIDHINHNGLDNRKSNLRILTHSSNLMNQYNDDNGIYQVKSGKYRSTICVNGKTIYLGTYDTFDGALNIRKQEERKYIK